MFAARRWCVLFFTMGCAGSLSATTQTTILTGYALSASEGNPLASARIHELGTHNYARTDNTGRFVIALPGTQTVTLQIEAFGYDAATLVIEPFGRDSIHIPRGAIRLNESINGVLERRAEGRGTFVDRAQINDWKPASLTDLLRHVPGLRLHFRRGHGLGTVPRGYTVTMARGPETCSPMIFLDGASMGPVAEYALDDLIAPDELAMVEVYRSPSEIPPRFQVLGAGCGVLALWTRMD